MMKVQYNKYSVLRHGSLLLCLMGVFFGSVQGALAEDKIVKLTSLEWPPFAGADLPEGGANTAVIRAAYEAMGYKVTVEYVPWNRAIQMVKTDKTYIGYYPEYDSASVRADFLLSASLGSSPVGFIEQVDKKITWNTLDDLKKYSIGVVDGYANTAEFDKMMADKTLNTEASADDVTNLRKVAAKRVDLAVMDKNVTNYYLTHDAELKGFASRLSFNPKILDDKHLYIAFRKDDDGKKMDDVLTQGLAKIDAKAIMAKHLGQ